MIVQRSILRLESALILTLDINKGKGMVFDYDSAALSNSKVMKPDHKERILFDAIQVGKAMSWKPNPHHTASVEVG